MTIKTLLGMAPNDRNNRNHRNHRNNGGSSWTFGWTSSQASAFSGNTKSGAKREADQLERQVGVYGVLAMRNGNGR